MAFSIKKPNSLILHSLLWIIFFVISSTPLYNRLGFLPPDFYLKWLVYLSIFYLNYKVLVPHLLLKKKFFFYSIAILLVVVFFVFVIEQLIPRPEMPMHDNFPKPNDFDPHKFKDGGKMYFPTVVLIFLFLTVSTSIKLGIEWYKVEKQKVLAESQKINSELTFLKAQLNPHFLFNSLNSIYSLANKKSDNTTDAIVTLSELMRYMIYETDKEKVPLQNEINYIKNYISLQNLRLKDSSGVKFNVHGNLDHSIEPLLLISFIENAFKYGTDYTGKTNIQIKITVVKNELTLQVINSISSKEKSGENSGIGISNVSSRLKILYPNTHSLKIEEENNLFKVELILKLKK